MLSFTRSKQNPKMVIHTKTTTFVLPTLDIPSDKLKEMRFLNSYLGYKTDNFETDKIYLRFPSSPEELKQHKFFVQEIQLDEGVLLVFNIPDEYVKSVIEPFIKGKYSEIDKEYVKKHFPRYYIIGVKPVRNPDRQILDKCDKWRQWLSSELDIEIPEDQEVWDKPTPETEVLEYTGEKEETYSPPENLFKYLID